MWFRRNKDWGVYEPREQKIYRYWNGQAMIAADPVVLWKKMMTVSQDLDKAMKVAMSIHTDNIKFHTKMVELIRGIFSIQDLEHGGLGETETVDLLNNFLTYCGFVKKNTNQPQTPSNQDSPTSSPEGQDTNNSSDSGSTDDEPNPDALTV